MNPKLPLFDRLLIAMVVGGISVYLTNLLYYYVENSKKNSLQ